MYIYIYIRQSRRTDLTFISFKESNFTYELEGRHKALKFYGGGEESGHVFLYVLREPR